MGVERDRWNRETGQGCFGFMKGLEVAPSPLPSPTYIVPVFPLHLDSFCTQTVFNTEKQLMALCEIDDLSDASAAHPCPPPPAHHQQAGRHEGVDISQHADLGFGPFQGKINSQPTGTSPLSGFPFLSPLTGTHSCNLLKVSQALFKPKWEGRMQAAWLQWNLSALLQLFWGK